MDRRTILALVLMAIVFIVTPILFPSSRPPAPGSDSTMTATTSAAPPTSATPAAPSAARGASAGGAPSAQQPAQPAQPTANAAAPAATERAAAARVAAPESVTFATPQSRFTLLNPGAVPSVVHVQGYRDLRPGRRDSVRLEQSRERGPLFRYRLALGRDTIALDTIPFKVQQSGTTTTFVAANPPITISYATTSDGFRTAVRGSVASAPPGSALIVDLPSELRSVEADTLDDLRHLAYAFKRPRRDVVSIGFSKLDSLATRVDTGAMQWVSVRNKYWLIALMTPVEKPTGASFVDLISRGQSSTGKVARVASATTIVPLSNGQFAFDLYAGPQSWQELHRLGNDLENVNPYAGFMHAVVQPFATIVMRTLLWMRATFRVNYGWVLVIFGVAIRLLLWPLNQKAMRTSIQMQRIQPELTAVQKKYKDDPEKQRDALMKLYKDHGMSPLSPMLGCLPMLLPMPVLFALYFVFQNTIELRGVSFLWLPDLSLRDPYYITPIVMGASMFLLSWIGMRGTPPNPQTQMMSYMMPVLFTVMFLNFASGLNLYYGVQNVAALPQQWMLSRERAKAGAATGAGAVAAVSTTRARSGGTRKT
jgi:YidC/Oxa1 family membrane protein insertase